MDCDLQPHVKTGSMNPRNFSGWLQILTGLLTLGFQGYSLFHGVSIDPGHAVIGAGMIASGSAHVKNGFH